jgi:xylulokinase
MDYLVGIDLGSTNLKAVIYDVQGNAVASGSRPTKRHHPNPDHPDWTVWQPDEIWGDAAASIRDAVAQLDDPSQIRGVAVTGMGMDGVPLDEEGNALYPFISWLCPRTNPQLEWWKKNIGADKSFAVGGDMLWSFSTAFRVLWMAEHEPEILARCHKWVLIEDFVNYKLCGRLATDYSMASGTLLFDLAKHDWSDEMLGLAGIDRGLWCDAHPSGTVLGEIQDAAAQETGLPAGTPVVLGGHDFQCGALPVGAFKPGVVLDVTGTWEILLTATERPVLTPALQAAGITVDAHVARDLYGPWGGAVASEMLEWYRKEYGTALLEGDNESRESEWKRLMAEAAKSPVGAKGVLFLPHMSGAGCPVVDARSRGAFVGLHGGATRSDLLRALIEGLNYQSLDIVNTMNASLGEDYEKFIVVGGAIRNEFWMQNKANVLGHPIEISTAEEATPLGAAILAGIGVGLYRDEQDAFDHVHKPGKTIEPNAEAHAFYKEGYETYKRLYPALRDINHQLSAY